MATTRFYLDTRGRARDGKGSIVITIYHNRTTATISTGIRVAPNHWNGETVHSVPGYDCINAHLAKRKAEIDKAIAFLSLEDGYESMTATQVKSRVDSKSKPVASSCLLSDLFHEYMDTGIKQGTRNIYTATLRKVKSFGGDSLKVTDIDLKWLLRFENFLSKTQGVNGRAIYLRSLRAVCNYALHTGATENYPFKNFKIKQEPTRKRDIPIEDFRRFMTYPAPERLSMYRDYFLLMFYLIGINSKDLLLARHSAINNGRFEYIREKTHKRYSIKIEPEAEELMVRWRGKDYLLDAMDHCKHYMSFSHAMNDALKEIGDVEWEMIPDPDDLFGIPRLEKKITPVIPGLTTYCARHSWATYAYQIGVPLDVISQALGHSDGNRTTLIYVKREREKVDEANRMVIDYLFGQG